MPTATRRHRSDHPPSALFPPPLLPSALPHRHSPHILVLVNQIPDAAWQAILPKLKLAAPRLTEMDLREAQQRVDPSLLEVLPLIYQQFIEPPIITRHTIGKTFFQTRE